MGTVDYSDLQNHAEEDDWGGLSEQEIEGIKAGLKDVAEGRVHTHEEAMRRITEKLKHLRK